MTQVLTSPNGTPASRFSFGTMQFGGKADADASRAMFEACLAAGVTHFDTAHVYTGGASETLLGEMIQPHRDALYIATKAAHDGGAGRANILASAETSRQRLQIDQLDALYMHRFDDDTPLEETFETLAELRAKGHVRDIGVSNYAAWQVVKAAGVAARFDLEIRLIQPMYSLVKRQAEVEILPMAQDLGLTVAAYSPLGGGLLTGKYARGGAGRLTEDDRYAARYGQDAMHRAAAELSQIAEEVGVDAVTLAVAWVAAHPYAPGPIISARSTEQLAPALAALEYTMPSELYTRLSALTPTPPPATDRLEEVA
ncbi:MAG: aldo/keto reductase [Pseudomonadota bacterium]